MLRITLDIWFTTLSIALWPSYDFQEEIKYQFFPGDSDGKESACNVGDLGLIPELGRSPGEGNSYPPVFLPGEFNGQRSLAGYRPWGCKQSDVTKWLTLSLLCAKLTSLTFLFLKMRLCFGRGFIQWSTTDVGPLNIWTTETTLYFFSQLFLLVGG